MTTVRCATCFDMRWMPCPESIYPYRTFPAGDQMILAVPCRGCMRGDLKEDWAEARHEACISMHQLADLANSTERLFNGSVEEMNRNYPLLWAAARTVSIRIATRAGTFFHMTPGVLGLRPSTETNQEVADNAYLWMKYAHLMAKGSSTFFSARTLPECANPYEFYRPEEIRAVYGEVTKFNRVTLHAPAYIAGDPHGEGAYEVEFCNVKKIVQLPAVEPICAVTSVGMSEETRSLRAEFDTSEFDDGSVKVHMSALAVVISSQHMEP